MRNLKKILALVLAMVMTFSVMATANAFTDDADIDATYEEATAVLAGLKVFEGRDTGAFDPKAPITRAEVAAIIYRIVTRDVEKKQVSIYADYNKFDDVKSADWFAGYVNFCANGELIQGYGNGKFGPNDQVTGYQALAMIQRALGYDQNGEFTGAGWEIRTASNAQELGILKNITAGTLGAPATREVVAEILFQAMLCSTVDYTMAFNYRQTGTTLMDGFGAKKVAGVITDTEIEDGTTTLADAYTVTTAGNFFVRPSSSKIDVTVSKTDADWTKVGYAAYVWVTGLNTTKGTAKAFTDVFVTGTNLSVTTDGTTIAAMTTKTNAAYVAGADAEVAKLAYFENGEVATSAINNVIGTKIALVDNDGNGKVDTVVATEYTPAQVTDVLERTVSGEVSDYSYTVATLNNRGSDVILAKDLMGVESLEEDDYITYVEVDGDAYVTMAGVDSGEFKSITRAKIGGSTVKAYTVDSTDYVASELINLALNVEHANGLVKENLNEVVVIVTDEYGYVIHAEVYSDPAAYLYVLANNHSNRLTGITEASVAYNDGNVEILNAYTGKTDVAIDELVNGLKTTDDGRIYSYAENKAGKVELTDVKQSYAKATYEADTVKFGTVNLTKNTVIVDLRDVIDGLADDGVVYTGYSELPAITDAEIYYLAANNVMTLGFLVDGTNTEDLAASFVVFDTTMNVVNKIDKDEYTYTLTKGVLVKGELVEGYVLSQKQHDAIDTYGVGVYKFDTNGDLAAYTSFSADTLTWEPKSSGDVIYGIKDITDSHEIIILDISAGKVNAWDRYVVDGTYYTYLDATNKIAYIVGDATVGFTPVDADDKRIPVEATKAVDKNGSPVYEVVAFDKSYDGNKYYVADGYVTMVEAAAAKYNVTVVNHVGAAISYTLNGKAEATQKLVAGTYELVVDINEGYEVSYTVTDDTKHVGGGVADGKFNIAVAGDVIIEITGKPVTTQYTLTYALAEGDEGKGTVPAAEQFDVTDLDLTLTEVATPATGYKFTGWVDDNGKAITAVTELEDTTVYAAFEEVYATLTVKFYNAAGQLMETWNSQEQDGSTYTIALDGVAVVDGEYYNTTTGCPVVVDGDTTVEVKYVDKVTVTLVNNYKDAYDSKFSFTMDVNEASVEGETTVVVTMKYDGDATWSTARNITWELTNAEHSSGKTSDTVSKNGNGGANGTTATITFKLSNVTGPVTITLK